MIHVERRLSPPPGFLKRAEHERRLAQDAIVRRGGAPREFFRETGRSPASLIREQLFELFHAKCAYCETPVERRSVGRDRWLLDPFRPRYNARGHAETEDVWRYRAHYWWLAWEWDNLYLACQYCKAAKRTWFPVVGERAEPESDVDEEIYLLIDPCRDDPLGFLEFTTDGRVRPTEPPAWEDASWWARRTLTTIQILRLNRSRLVEGRRERLADFAKAREKAELRRFLVAEAPFAGACRSLVMQQSPVPGDLRSTVLKEVLRRTGAPPKPLARTVVLEAEAMPDVRGAHAYLESIRIENFRSVGRLELKLATEPETEAEADEEKGWEETRATSPESERQAWRVFLGENGSGKSSVLQAVALALAGEERAHRLLKLRRVRHRELQRRAPRGKNYDPPGPLCVEVTLSGAPHRIRYVLRDGKLHFEEGAEGVATLVRGYGTSRLPPRRPQDLPERPEPFNADNLFDPHATLIDAETWLMNMKEDDPTFERAAKALSALFLLPAGSFYRTKTAVKVKRGRERARLKDLSDGYQALTGLVADLMAAVPGGFDDLGEETGIVLIDELGVHLHPKWRMSVVAGLREAFPGFQFLATTHEPLCLRGLEDGEVGVMWRLPSGLSVMDQEVPPVAGLRVDQLLTSPYFGLSTTIDPALDAKFEEYYQLLARRGHLRRKNKMRLEALGTELERYRVLGYTRRDQLVYQILDEYLADSRALTPEKRRALDEETKKKVLDVWRRVKLSAEDQQ